MQRTSKDFVDGVPAPTATDDPEMPQLLRALEAIHDPRSSNELRHEATAFLERAKLSPQAFRRGFKLAVNPSPTGSGANAEATAAAAAAARDTVVRHFGLSMMTYYLKYVFEPDDDASGDVSSETLPEYTIQLTHSLRAEDPPFVRNKVAQIWTDVAKRVWGGPAWRHMDEQLVSLWSMSAAHRMFVLTVLETLSDDIFNHEDHVAGLRSDLGSALTRICVTEDFFAEFYPRDRHDPLNELRYGQEGWLLRLCDYLKVCLDQSSSQDDQAVLAAVRVLNVLQSLCCWLPLKSLISASCVQSIAYALAVGNTQIRLAATDALCAIFVRINVDTGDLENIIAPLFSRESLQLLHDAYLWASEATVNEDEKYTFVKKISELLTSLGAWAEINPRTLQKSGNTAEFFSLFLLVTKHPSLLVSLPLLQVWHRLLRNKTPDFSEIVEESIGALLQLCSERCIRYDLIPENSGNPALEYLAVDCDNITQRDAILAQYRQTLVHVIEQIVRKVPLEAIKHILGEASKFFHDIANKPFSPTNYAKVSPTSMAADAHFATIESAMKGCQRWQATHIDANPDVLKNVEQKGNELRLLLSQWCQTSLSISIQDPDVKRKLITQAVTITCKVTPQNSDVAFNILDALLSIRREDPNGSPQYQEAVKELFEMSAYSALKLASVYADAFLGIYEQLENRVEEIVAQDEDLRPRYFAFLVMIIHRASNLDTETRTERLRRMISPVSNAWRDPELNTAVESYENFCNSVGWSRLPEFLAASNFHQLKDWSAQTLNKEGLEFQADLLRRNDAIPIKLTKALLHATTEKLEDGSTAFAIARTVWAEVLPSILPNLFKILSYATIFQNPARWPTMPDQIKAAMVRLLQDRFWQSGISNESRDTFVARVSNSKNTYDGLGSSVRKTLRQVRTGSCDIILLLAKLGETFYGIPDMSAPLSQAVYEDAEALSSHHFNVLIHFSNHLISGCPVHLRGQFLPPVISSLFQRLRFKIDFEWDVVNRHTEQATNDDNLDEEMKNQSILRSMTFAACNLLWGLIKRRGETDKAEESESNIFRLITTMPTVLEQVLLFATSALRVRDTHSVNLVLLTLRDIIPLFARAGPVHDFLCHDVLRAAITSLHEPYFVDLQKDLASLIVYIIQLDPPSSVINNGSNPAEGAASSNRPAADSAGEAGPASEADPAAAVLASLPGLAEAERTSRRVAQAVKRVRSLAPHARAAAAAAAAAAAGQSAGQSREAGPAPAHGPSVQAQAQDMRAARAVVLDLLEQIRGVSIHEMGRIASPAALRKTTAAAAGPNGHGGDAGRAPARVLMQALHNMQVDAAGAPAIVRGGSPDLEGVANLLS